MMKKVVDQIKKSRLLTGKVLDSLSESEKEAFEKWKLVDNNDKLFDEIIDEKTFAAWLSKRNSLDLDSAWDSFINEMDSKNKNSKTLKVNFYKAVASVAAVLILGVSIYTAVDIFKTTRSQTVAESMIEPGKTKAELVLADGKIVVLDENTNNIIEEKGTVIANEKGVLEYNNTENIEEAAINHLRVPKGGEYKLVLPDGTTVWLNANTTLSYPVAFNGSERRVNLIGEAYFEVTKNKKQPFIVVSEDQDIRVLGTSFNVSAYSDDANIVTTLVEGSVQVTYEGREGYVNEVLCPNYQLSLNKENKSALIEEVDTYLYTSWKDGRFEFRKEPLESFMKKIARWYDVEVLFMDEDVKNINFSGALPRYEEMSDLIKILEMEMSVNVEVENDKVIYISR